MRLLLVEDSKRLAVPLRRGLCRAGFAVDIAYDGEEGLWLAESNDYDVIVLDLMLPKLDGISLLQRLRAQGRKTHVLILTARDSPDDRVHGLEQGADDYLTKPFHLRELIARVRALARRSYGVKTPRLIIGDLKIDLSSRVVSRKGKVIRLKPREYAVLEFLALREGEVVSRTEIEEHIYDERVEAASNVVDSAICILRRELDRPGEPSLIHTRRGMGYMLKGPEKGNGENGEAG
jgi:DNA-binding response OmpR family regulator